MFDDLNHSNVTYMQKKKNMHREQGKKPFHCINIHIYAIKRLVAINHIQNKSFCLHNIYVCVMCIFIMYT